jgi:hypothetical protein
MPILFSWATTDPVSFVIEYAYDGQDGMRGDAVEIRTDTKKREEMDKSGLGTYRLISLALRTFVAMNLLVV